MVETSETVLGLPLCGVGVDAASLCRLPSSSGDSLTGRRNGAFRNGDSSSSESASASKTDCGEDDADELAVDDVASSGSVGVARELWIPESGLPRLP